MSEAKWTPEGPVGSLVWTTDQTNGARFQVKILDWDQATGMLTVQVVRPGHRQHGMKMGMKFLDTPKKPN